MPEPQEPASTESIATVPDPVAEGLELTRQVLRALPPEDEEDRAYRDSIEATITSVESLSEAEGSGGVEPR